MEKFAWLPHGMNHLSGGLEGAYDLVANLEQELP
jgi:hypothetical protein